MRQRVALRVGAWGLIVIFGLSACAWLASARWTVFRMAQFGDSVGLRGGVVFYLWTSPSLRTRLAGQHGLPTRLRWQWHGSPRRTPMEWLPQFYASTPSGRSHVAIPLWPIVVLSGGGAAALWLRSRPLRAGLCQKCGYDLRGIDGVCPECGAQAA
jgi:hypothetical protein